MRSRYTAYVTSNEDYLKASWHPSTCPSEPLTDASIKWLALELRSAEEQGDEATKPVVLCVRRVSGCTSMVRLKKMTKVSEHARS